MIKKLVIVTGLFFLGSSIAFSQSVNGKAIAEIDVEYVQIVGSAKLFSQKVNINIDFGQENKVFKAKDTQIRDANGKLTTFNSMIDALNFMSKCGYEFVDAYTLTVSNQNVYHYLLKKKGSK